MTSEVTNSPPWKNTAKKSRYFPSTDKDEQIQNVQRVKLEKEIQLAAREQRKKRRVNEKRETMLMKLEDFDVVDSLAGIF